MCRPLTPAFCEDIEHWEGKVVLAYDDADSPNTRRKIKVGDKVRGTPALSSGQAQADALRDPDLDRFEAAVSAW